MTCIVEGFPSKKSLKAAIDQGEIVFIKDPSIFAPRTFKASEIPEGKMEVVTNHPKRSWFASIEKKNGELIVK